MIAILGGYGEVGSATARALLVQDMGPLRIGGRNGAAAAAMAESLGDGRAEGIEVDCSDPASLAPFLSGCRLLLNCAGPSHRLGAGPALAALQAGVDYVDVAGDDRLHAQLAELEHTEYRQRGCRALLSAGLQPGLTGLLPRWLATRLPQVKALTSYFGLLDHFTAVAADDYLQSLEEGFGQPLAAWRNGRRPGALVRESALELPFFPDPVTALPYLNREAERLAASLKLERGDWYTAVVGRHILAAFERLHGLSRAQAAALLQRSSCLDMAGRRPFVNLLLQAESGDGASGRAAVSLAFCGRSNGELSGAFAAVACRALFEQCIPSGRHFTAMAVEPVTAVNWLRTTGAVAGFTLVDGPLASFTQTEEGVL